MPAPDERNQILCFGLNEKDSQMTRNPITIVMIWVGDAFMPWYKIYAPLDSISSQHTDDLRPR